MLVNYLNFKLHYLNFRVYITCICRDIRKKGRYKKASHNTNQEDPKMSLHHCNGKDGVLKHGLEINAFSNWKKLKTQFK